MGIFSSLFNKNKAEMNKSETEYKIVELESIETEPEEEIVEYNYLFSHFIDSLSYYSPEFNKVMVEINDEPNYEGEVYKLNLESDKIFSSKHTPNCMNTEQGLRIVSSFEQEGISDRYRILTDTIIDNPDRYQNRLDVIRYLTDDECFYSPSIFGYSNFDAEQFSTLIKCCNLMLFDFEKEEITHKEIVSIILMSLTTPVITKLGSEFPHYGENDCSDYWYTDFNIDNYLLRHYVKTPENEEKVRETVELAISLVQAHEGSDNFKSKPRLLLEAYIQLEACIRILKNLDCYPETKEVLSKMEKVRALNINNIELVKRISTKADKHWQIWSKDDRRKINTKLTKIYNDSYKEISKHLSELEKILDKMVITIENTQLKDKELDSLLEQLD